MSSNAVVRPLRRYDADSSDLVCELLRDAQRARGLGPESSAELLGVTRPTLYDLMAKYGIRADEDQPAPQPLNASQK